MQHGPLKDDHKKRQCCHRASPCSCAVRPQYVQHGPAVHGSVCPRLLNPAPASPARVLQIQWVPVLRSGSCCRWQALRAAGTDDIGHACAGFDFEFHASLNVQAPCCDLFDSSLVPTTSTSNIRLGESRRIPVAPVPVSSMLAQTYELSISLPASNLIELFGGIARAQSFAPKESRCMHHGARHGQAVMSSHVMQTRLGSSARHCVFDQLAQSSRQHM